MGQEEVLNILKKNPNKYFSVEELSLKMGVSVPAVRKSLYKLFEQNYLSFKRFGLRKRVTWSGK